MRHEGRAAEECLAGPGVANPVTTWVGANTPTQTTSGNSTIVTIQQTQAQALLTWSSFNVGANTTLNFNQQPGWLAINKVNNPSGVPSQILGTINAIGRTERTALLTVRRERELRVEIAVQRAGLDQRVVDRQR